MTKIINKKTEPPKGYTKVDWSEMERDDVIYLLRKVNGVGVAKGPYIVKDPELKSIHGHSEMIHTHLYYMGILTRDGSRVGRLSRGIDKAAELLVNKIECEDCPSVHKCLIQTDDMEWDKVLCKSIIKEGLREL